MKENSMELALEDNAPNRRLYLVTQYMAQVVFVALAWQFTHAWKDTSNASLFGDLAEVLGYVIIMASLLSFAEVEEPWGTWRVPLDVAVTRKAKAKSILSHIAFVFEKTHLRQVMKYVKETCTPVSNFIVGPLQRLFYVGVRISRTGEAEKVQVVSRKNGVMDYTPSVPLKCSQGAMIPSLAKARLENRVRSLPFCRPTPTAISQRYGKNVTVVDFSAAIIASALLTLAKLL